VADLDDIVNILEQIRDDTVPGLTSAVQDLSNATDAAAQASQSAADAARDTSNATDELADSMSNLSDQTEEAEKSSSSFSNGLSKMGKGMKGVVGGLKGMGGALAALDPLAPARDIMKLTQDMRRSTGMSKQMAQEIGRTTDSLRIYGVDAKEAALAVESLYTETSVFSQMSGEMQANLAKEAALMAELGVTNSDYSKGIEVSMKSMGMSADQAVDNMRQMRATSIDLGIPISQLTDNFKNNGEMLAKLGDNGIAAFSELSRISKVTGMEMNKLLAVTDKFDTFEGAAEAAGSLNAALGGNFVDSMSLMMETDPAERFKMIRNAVDDAGVAFEDMGYYQKKMMADAAGFSDVGEFAKAMSGDLSALAGDMGETDASIEAAQKEAFTVRTPQEIAEQMANAIKPAFGEIANTLADAGEKFANKMLPATQALNQASISLTKDAMPSGGFMTFIMGLVAYLPIIISNLAKFGPMLSSIGTIFSGAFSFIGGVFTTIGGFLTSAPVLIAALVTAFVGGIMGIRLKYDEIMAVFEVDPFAGLYLAAEAFMTGVIATFGKIAAYIAEAFGFEAPWIDLFKNSFDPENFDKIKDQWFAWITGLSTKIAELFTDYIVVPIMQFDFGESIESVKDSIVQGFKDFFDISSPSKLMQDLIGGPMIEGMLAPFMDIGTRLKELMMAGLEMIPAPIKDIMLGKSVFETAGDLAGMAAEKASGVVEAITGRDDAAKEPYQLNISMNMDGREIDKKVVNVVGGIARDATGV
tara:strand:+ start:973 stop:3240 length:2268 start_codon:yes stop_codon:yes gene_type:complete